MEWTQHARYAGINFRRIQRVPDLIYRFLLLIFVIYFRRTFPRAATFISIWYYVNVSTCLLLAITACLDIEGYRVVQSDVASSQKNYSLDMCGEGGICFLITPTGKVVRFPPILSNSELVSVKTHNIDSGRSSYRFS